MQAGVLGDLLPPDFMKTGVVIASVVGDNHGLAPGPSRHPFKFAEKLPAGLDIEHALGLRHHQLPVGHPILVAWSKDTGYKEGIQMKERGEADCCK